MFPLLTAAVLRDMPHVNYFNELLELSKAAGIQCGLKHKGVVFSVCLIWC